MSEEIKLICAYCGYVDVFNPSLKSQLPHEPKPLTCPECGSVEWLDDEDEEGANG